MPPRRPSLGRTTAHAEHQISRLSYHQEMMQKKEVRTPFSVRGYQAVCYSTNGKGSSGLHGYILVSIMPCRSLHKYKHNPYCVATAVRTMSG